jgi:hypothetical protein
VLDPKLYSLHLKLYFTILSFQHQSSQFSLSPPSNYYLNYQSQTYSLPLSNQTNVSFLLKHALNPSPIISKRDSFLQELQKYRVIHQDHQRREDIPHLILQ